MLLNGQPSNLNEHTKLFVLSKITASILVLSDSSFPGAWAEKDILQRCPTAIFFFLLVMNLGPFACFTEPWTLLGIILGSELVPLGHNLGRWKLILVCGSLGYSKHKIQTGLDLPCSQSASGSLD